LYNKGDYDQLRATLSDFRCTFFNSSLEANSVDANWNHFTQAISAAIDECIPSKLTSSRSKRPSAWLNAPVRKLIRKWDHLAKVAKKTGLTIDRDRYHKARNKASAAIVAGYRDHLNTILGNVVSDPRAFYRVINSKRMDTTSIPPIKSNNKVLLTDIDKAQCLNNYFGSVFTVEKDASIPISTSLYPDMPDIQVTTPGVLKLLSQLDVRKSMGPDGISPRILKETSREVAPILTFIFNQLLSSGVVPQDWRLANIFALHKKGPKDLAENYRPISVTSICSKVLEHIVYSSISNFLDDNQILTPRQHGFRSGHSCEMIGPNF